MEKLVHRIITHQSFAPGIKGGEYYYCDGVDREINQAMQEPLKKLYKYENQPEKNDLQGRLDELDLKKYTIIATAEDITECQMILDNEQLETIVSVFKELDKNRRSDFCPWYEIEDEEGKMIYKTECI